MKDPVIQLRKYIGRGYASYNCFQLVHEFYTDFYGLDLMHYWQDKKVPSRKDIESLIVSNKGDFVAVDKPQFGDIVLISLYGIECHMGVVIEPGVMPGTGKFLHSVRGCGSLLDRLERYSKLIAGYYRHRELNDQATT